MSTWQDLLYTFSLDVWGNLVVLVFVLIFLGHVARTAWALALRGWRALR